MRPVLKRFFEKITDGYYQTSEIPDAHHHKRQSNFFYHSPFIFNNDDIVVAYGLRDRNLNARQQIAQRALRGQPQNNADDARRSQNTCTDAPEFVEAHKNESGRNHYDNETEDFTQNLHLSKYASSPLIVRTIKRLLTHDNFLQNRTKTNQHPCNERNRQRREQVRHENI